MLVPECLKTADLLGFSHVYISLENEPKKKTQKTSSELQFCGLLIQEREKLQ